MKRHQQEKELALAEALLQDDKALATAFSEKSELLNSGKEDFFTRSKLPSNSQIVRMFTSLAVPNIFSALFNVVPQIINVIIAGQF